MQKILTFFILTFSFCWAQSDSISINQISSMSNDGVILYNVEGINFSSQILEYTFEEINFKSAMTKFGLKQKNSYYEKGIPYNNLTVKEVDQISDSLIRHDVHYFIENPNGKIQVFWFGYYEDLPLTFVNKIINWVVNDSIPTEKFVSETARSINFAGRTIPINGYCYWVYLNSFQCPSNGHINWSLHSNLESARKSNHYQLLLTKSKKSGKVISEEIVDVEFEGVPTKAKKVVYRLTGISSLLVWLSSRGKTLTIYYVSEKVRDHYVSCVLSHWNNDFINPSGLPFLLEQVMKL